MKRALLVLMLSPLAVACGRSTNESPADAGNAADATAIVDAFGDGALDGALVDGAPAVVLDAAGGDAVAACAGKNTRFKYELIGSTADATQAPRSFDGLVAGDLANYEKDDGQYLFLLSNGTDVNGGSLLQIFTSGAQNAGGPIRVSGYFSGGPASYGLRWMVTDGTLTIKKRAGSELEAEVALTFTPNSTPEFSGGVTGDFTLKGTISTSCFHTKPGMP